MKVSEFSVNEKNIFPVNMYKCIDDGCVRNQNWKIKNNQKMKKTSANYQMGTLTHKRGTMSGMWAIINLFIE